MLGYARILQLNFELGRPTELRLCVYVVLGNLVCFAGQKHGTPKLKTVLSGVVVDHSEFIPTSEMQVGISAFIWGLVWKPFLYRSGFHFPQPWS